jgi:hypothetical protein
LCEKYNKIRLLNSYLKQINYTKKKNEYYKIIILLLYKTEFFLLFKKNRYLLNIIYIKHSLDMKLLLLLLWNPYPGRRPRVLVPRHYYVKKKKIRILN